MIELRSAEFKSDVVNKGWERNHSDNLTIMEGILSVNVTERYKEGGSKLIISSLHTYCMMPRY